MIIKRNDNNYIIFLYKEEDENIDFFNYELITNFFKNLLFYLKMKYKICGLCYIDVYVNNNFGMIIEIDNIYGEDNNVINSKIKFHINSIFLCEIDYTDDYIKDIYYYEGKYYTHYNYEIDSNIIYKDYLKIIKNGVKIK